MPGWPAASLLYRVAAPALLSAAVSSCTHHSCWSQLRQQAWQGGEAWGVERVERGKRHRSSAKQS